ncbi:MAG TPA: phospholipid carrier-dependent glycosyltransferase [Novosphingobium sp.]|nr:phospholipid carrier-dependent glycosyltransferase [Novosphingobium sp.]
MNWRRIAARLEGPWSPGRYWLLAGSALLALLCWLPHPYNGEEPVYAITTIETWWHGSWLDPMQLGAQYGRPPLLNWVVMVGVWLLGWDHILLAMRLIALASTLGMAAMVAWFAHYLSRDRLVSAFAVACFLTGDLLTQRGWMAYADPLLALATFAAIICLWVAVDRRSPGLLVLAGIAITAAFLTKALTAYAFYGAAGLILLWRHENRRFLISPPSLIIHACIIGFAPLWIFADAGWGQNARLIGDITARAHTGGLGRYILSLLTYWGEMLLRLLPPSALWLALIIRPGLRSSEDPCPKWSLTLRWILLLAALPYLVTTDNHARHLLPLYPLFAIVVAELALRRGRRLLAPLHAALIAWIVVTIPVALVISPWAQIRQHGNSAEVAALIDGQTRGHPIYTGDGSSETLAVIAHLDVLRLPAEPIGTGPRNIENGFFLYQAPPPEKAGKEVARYQLGKMSLALLCRGTACKP